MRPVKYSIYCRNTSEARVVPRSSRVSALVISTVVLVMFWLSTISPIREIMGLTGMLQDWQIGTRLAFVIYVTGYFLLHLGHWFW